MNENSRRLHKEIVHALAISDCVKVDITAYANYLHVSVRSAQRYLHALQQRAEKIPSPEYEIFRKAHDSARYFSRPGQTAVGRAALESDWTPKKPNDKNDKNDNLSLLYIYILRDNSLVSDTNKNGLSPATSQTTTATSQTPEVENITIWYAETDGAFQDLANAVCTVCKINPLLLLEEDEAKIKQLFRARVDPDELVSRYGYYNRPNYWYNKHWKGIKGGWPTINDIMQTWEKSAAYVPSRYDTWPPVKEIQDSIIDVMNIHKRNIGAATKDLTKLGFEIIIDNIPGGYYQMTLMNETKLRVAIAEVVRDLIKAETDKNKQFA